MTNPAGLQVLGYRVLIKPDAVQEKTKGGIIIQTDKRLDKFNQQTGTIVSIGAQAWTDVTTGEPWAKVGDYVLYAKYGATRIVDPTTQDDATQEGDEYILVADQDVLCKITKENKE